MGVNQTVIKVIVIPALDAWCIFFRMQTETALIYDAVQLFARALHDLDRSQNVDTRPLSCDGSDTWRHGNSLVNYMKLVEMTGTANDLLRDVPKASPSGLSGPIKFDQHGLRTGFELEIVELKRDGLLKVGTWNEAAGVNFTRNFTESYNEIVESLANKTLVVTTILVRHFLNSFFYLMDANTIFFIG